MDRYFTVKQLVKLEQFGWLTEASLRQLLFLGNENGLNKSGAILRLGRKILIDVTKFHEWVSRHRI